MMLKLLIIISGEGVSDCHSSLLSKDGAAVLISLTMGVFIHFGRHQFETILCKGEILRDDIFVAQEGMERITLGALVFIDVTVLFFVDQIVLMYVMHFSEKNVSLHHHSARFSVKIEELIAIGTRQLYHFPKDIRLLPLYVGSVRQ